MRDYPYYSSLRHQKRTWTQAFCFAPPPSSDKPRSRRHAAVVFLPTIDARSHLGMLVMFRSERAYGGSRTPACCSSTPSKVRSPQDKDSISSRRFPPFGNREEMRRSNSRRVGSLHDANTTPGRDLEQSGYLPLSNLRRPCVDLCFTPVLDAVSRCSPAG